MLRRSLFGLMMAALPASAWAQPQRAAQHDAVLGQEFAALPPGAKERVTAAFRQGDAQLPAADVEQRWNAMTPAQRGEVLTMHERRMGRQGRGRGPGAGPAAPPARPATPPG